MNSITVENEIINLFRYYQNKFKFKTEIGINK